ncbi:MAG: hypothetical protein RhofKO_26740 [Rhodothermales bacterium]
MTWLKNVLVDLLVAITIVATALGVTPWLLIPLYIYTGLMLVLKGAALGMSGLLNVAKRGEAETPAWFMHGIYILCMCAWLFTGHTVLGIGWAAIWLLSAAAERRMTFSVPAK